MTDASAPRIPARSERAATGKPGQAAKILVAGLSASVTLGLVASMGHAAASGAGKATDPVTTATPQPSVPLVVVNGQTIRLDQLQQYLDALAAAGQVTVGAAAASSAIPVAPQATTPPTGPPSGPGSVESAGSVDSPKVAPSPAVESTMPGTQPPASPAVPATPVAPGAPAVPATPAAPATPTVPATPAPVFIDIPVPVPAPVAAPVPVPAQGNGSSRQS